MHQRVEVQWPVRMAAMWWISIRERVWADTVEILRRQSGQRAVSRIHRNGKLVKDVIVGLGLLFNGVVDCSWWVVSNKSVIKDDE